MTAIHVAYHDGAHRCYVTETGRDRRYVGCRHLSPRSAIEHSDRLAVRPTHSEASAFPSEDAAPGLRGAPASSPSTVRSHPATAGHESRPVANPQTPVRSGSRLGDLPLQPGFGS